MQISKNLNMNKIPYLSNANLIHVFTAGGRQEERSLLNKAMPDSGSQMKTSLSVEW